jgi:hypothetical protein
MLFLSIDTLQFFLLHERNNSVVGNISSCQVTHVSTSPPGDVIMTHHFGSSGFESFNSSMLAFSHNRSYGSNTPSVERSLSMVKYHADYGFILSLLLLSFVT